jgi:hypothetical protein
MQHLIAFDLKIFNSAANRNRRIFSSPRKNLSDLAFSSG